MEEKITDILIIILLLVFIIVPFLCIYKIIENNTQKIYVNQLEQRINQLEFEREYLEYVYEDNKNQ